MGMDPKFLVYIDEAGDPGVKPKSTDERLWTDWFSLSAVVVRATRDLEVVDWVADMREAVRSHGTKGLHYRTLSETNRERVTRMLGRKPVRIFALASLKDTMRDHYNPVLGRANDKEFYNWCLRLLLERVTEWCYRKCLADNEPVAPAKIMFSERGGHDYHELRAYLTRLEAQTLTKTLVLKKRGLAPGIIFSSHCQVRPHADVAGLQLADIAASAIFQAACSVGNKHCLKPAQNLKPVFPKCARTKRIADFSLLRLPFAHQGTIPLEDRPIFEHFGYKFEKG